MVSLEGCLYVFIQCALLTGQNAATTTAISDRAIVDTKLSFGKTVIPDTVLSITELTDRRPVRAKMEAAATSAANKGLGSGSKGRESNIALHVYNGEQRRHKTDSKLFTPNSKDPEVNYGVKQIDSQLKMTAYLYQRGVENNSLPQRAGSRKPSYPTVQKTK